MDMHVAGIEGRMFKFIQNFPKFRYFKVKVNVVLSDTKVQTKGIAQGSVVSPTFFILNINKIVAKLPIDNRYQIQSTPQKRLLFSSIFLPKYAACLIKQS